MFGTDVYRQVARELPRPYRAWIFSAGDPGQRACGARPGLCCPAPLGLVVRNEGLPVRTSFASAAFLPLTNFTALP